MDSDDRISLLLSWATSNGTTLHPSVQIYDDPTTGLSFRVSPSSTTAHRVPTLHTESPSLYDGARTEEAFVSFLNTHCGTHRAPGGLLDDTAGRHPEFDSLASRFVVAAADKVAQSKLYEDAKLFGRATGAKYKYYLKVMEKVMNGTEGWVEKEAARYVAFSLCFPPQLLSPWLW